MKGISIVWLSKTDLTNLNAGEGETNYIDIKKFRKEGKEFPYVSGQAMRFYIKEAIRRNLKDNEYMCVPDSEGIAGCLKDIEKLEDYKEKWKEIISKCIGCDLFGFMKPIGAAGSITRISPLKVAPAIGLLPFDENSVIDFLTRKKYRGVPAKEQEIKKQESDIVNVEIGTNIYKCGLSLDMVRIGSEEVVDQENRTVKIESAIDENKKKTRIQKVLEALRYLTDYSKQARLLTDFTPDVICIAFQNIYSHRLQKLFEFISENGKIVRKLDVKRMKEILSDVKDYSDKIMFGMISGVIENEKEVRETLQKFGIEVKTPREVIEEALKYINEAVVE